MKLTVVALVISLQMLNVEPRAANPTYNGISRYSSELAKNFGNLPLSSQKRAKQQELADKIQKLLQVQGNPKVEQAKTKLEKQLEVNFIKFLSVILLASPHISERSQDDLLRVMREALNGQLDFKPVVNKLPELLRHDEPNRFLLLIRTIDSALEDNKQEDPYPFTKNEGSGEEGPGEEYSVEENTEGGEGSFEPPPVPGNQQVFQNQGAQTPGSVQPPTNNKNQGNTSGNQFTKNQQNSGNSQPSGNAQQGNQGGQGGSNEVTATTAASTTKAPNNWDGIIEALTKIDLKEVGTFLKEIPAIFEGIQAIIDGVEEFF